MIAALRMIGLAVAVAVLVAACGGGHKGSTSSRFSIAAGGVLKDPQGKTFTPVGVNVSGPDWVWPGATAPSVGGMAAWHFNTIRVNTLSFCHPKVPCLHANDDLDPIVKAFTSRHYVVIISQFDYGAGTDPTRAQQDRLRAWWGAVAARYKDNPYVWFDPINEPTSPTATSGGETYAQALSRWWNIETNIADSIHAAAPDSMLVIEGTAAGEDKGTWACSHTPDFGYPLWSNSTAGGSAGIVEGHDLQLLYGAQHVIISPHVYGAWAGIGNDRGCVGPASDPYRYWRYDMNVYFDKLRAENLPVLVGEWGAVNNLADEPYYQQGSWDAARILMEQVAPNRNVKPGVLHWQCSPYDQKPLARPDAWCLSYDPAKPTGRTLLWQGRDLFNYAKLVNP